jgi:hypothetical protein
MTTTLYCSFCGKAQLEVAKLIAGPTSTSASSASICATTSSIRAKPVPTLDIHAVADHGLDEIRRMVLTVASRIASLRYAIERLRRSPLSLASPAEIIGFDKPE